MKLGRALNFHRDVNKLITDCIIINSDFLQGGCERSQEGRGDASSMGHLR